MLPVKPTYRQRIINGYHVLRLTMVGHMLIPTVLFTAAIGCWRNPRGYSSWRLGDILVSSMLTTLLGFPCYAVLAFWIGMHLGK